MNRAAVSDNVITEAIVLLQTLSSLASRVDLPSVLFQFSNVYTDTQNTRRRHLHRAVITCCIAQRRAPDYHKFSRTIQNTGDDRRSPSQTWRNFFVCLISAHEYNIIVTCPLHHRLVLIYLYTIRMINIYK